MPRYLLLTRNTPKGAAFMLQSLTTGAEEYPRSVERFGRRIVGEVLALAGRYDAAAIVDFDDPAAMLAFGLSATVDGQYIEALPVFDKADLGRAENIARAASKAYEDERARFVDEIVTKYKESSSSGP